MEPLSILSALAPALGGGSTKVSQTSSNTASALISANISGISNNPTTGAPYNPQTTTASASSSGSESGGGLLPGIFSSGSEYSSDELGAGYGGVSGADIAAAGVTGALDQQNVGYVVAAVALVAGGAWFMFGRK